MNDVKLVDTTYEGAAIEDVSGLTVGRTTTYSDGASATSSMLSLSPGGAGETGEDKRRIRWHHGRFQLTRCS